MTMWGLKTYMIYIPEEGHWPIRGAHANLRAARKAYLAWAGRDRLPTGAKIMLSAEERCAQIEQKERRARLGNRAYRGGQPQRDPSRRPWRFVDAY